MTWDCKSALLVLIRRFLPALAALVLGVWILLRATNPIQMLVGLLFFLVAAIFVAGPIARLLAEPTGNLFWPRRYYNKPQPMYGIPQSRRAKGQLEEALAEYEKIAADHPDEVRPWLEMIAIAIEDLKAPDRAQAIFERGVATLKNPDARDLLAKTYAEIRTRLDTRPPHSPIPLPPPHSGR